MTDRTVQHPPFLQAGKRASAALIDAFGGQVAAAAEIGRAQSRLSDYGGPNAAWFMPIDAVAMLERSTHGTPGHPHVTRWLCRNAGGEFLALPAARAASVHFGVHAAALTREAGDLVSGLCTDIASAGDVSPAEARGRIEAADDLVRVAVELRAALKARAEED